MAHEKIINLGLVRALSQPSTSSGKPMLSALKSHTVGLLTGKRISEDHIAWLWEHMTSAYGFKFMKLFGVKDNGVWLEALSDLAPEDLSYGFKKLLKSISEKERESAESWPPNVKEFRMLCEC